MARRLNFQLIGGFRFYQRQEIKDLLAYLTLVMKLQRRRGVWSSDQYTVRGLGD